MRSRLAYSSLRAWLAAAVVLVSALTFVPAASAEVNIPPVPPEKHYILDKAGLISADAMEKIGGIQKTAALDHKTQIVVVTIENKAKYGGQYMSIEGFARQWFDEWGIGIRRDGKLYNRGILMLVSKGDRKARIELGADWGHRWDEYCQRVMDEMMVPQFKNGQYSLGIIRGVDALSSMAERGPFADPPKPSVVEQWLREAQKWTSCTSPFSGRVQILFVIAGIVLILLSFFIEDETSSRVVFWAGVACIVIGILTYVIAVALAAFGRSKSGGSVGGFSGGGGYGGGFSGGGGATGSW